MNLITMTRNLILIIGWPILVIGSIYLVMIVRGKKVYQMIKGSLIGRLITVFLANMLIGMYALGLVSTAYMFDDTKSVYLILPVFIVWFAGFIWAIKTLRELEAEVKKLSKGEK